MFLKQVGKPSQVKEKEYQESLTTFRIAIDAALENNASLFSEEHGQMTDAQKKALAFVIFFAGQETTGFLGAQLLLKLAQNATLQQKLRELLQSDEQRYGEEIEALINCTLAERPPAYAFARRIADREGSKDLCLEYLLDRDLKKRKFIFRKGDGLVARMIDASHRILAQYKQTNNKESPLFSPHSAHPPLSPDQWSGFGGGKHKCPGRNLALKEIKTLLQVALQGYQLTTKVQHIPAVVGHITLQFAESISIQVSKLAM